MKMFLYPILACTLTGFLHAGASEWNTWRGPEMNGRAVGALPPASWNATKNVLWKFDMPTRSGSTPVIVDGTIYITSIENEENILIALDLNGKERWRRSAGTAIGGKHRKGSGANPSVATDGQHVVAYFRSGDLACFDAAGKKLWQQNVQTLFGADTLWWDLGTSPVMTDRDVVVAVMQSGPCFLVAFNKTTGVQSWKVDRMLDAPEESLHAYTTPILAKENGTDVLLVLGSDHVTSHDAATGAERWRVGGLNPKRNMNFRSIASPVVVGDIVAAPYARGSTLTGIKMGGQGDVTASHTKWVVENHSTDVPCPTTDGRYVYVLTDKGNITCIDPENGTVKWTFELPRDRTTFSSSPLLIGNRIYCTRENGTSYVVEFNDAGATLLATNEIDEMTVASPVAVNGRLYLKTEKALYCIAE